MSWLTQLLNRESSFLGVEKDFRNLNVKFPTRIFVIFLGLVIAIIVFYVVYHFISQLETPLWVLQYTFYAFMTAIFGFIFVGILPTLIRDYSKERKMKKIEEKKVLESFRDEFERCAWSIEENIKNGIEKNVFTDFHAGLYCGSSVLEKMKICEDLKKQVDQYAEKSTLYNVLRMSSMCIIGTIITTWVNEKFPKTLKKPHPLDKMILQSDVLMFRYFNGEKVNESWFKDTHPTQFKNIFKDVDDSEKDEGDEVNNFFLSINDEIERNQVLKRYRKEKEELIKHGKETVAKLRKQRESVNERLKKYIGLRMTESTTSVSSPI